MNIEEIVSKYASTADKLELDQRTHTYLHDGVTTYKGRPISSVTQFLSILKNKEYERIAEHYRNNAALIGSMVHAVTEAIDVGAEVDEYKLAKEILYLNGYLTHESTVQDIEYYMNFMLSDIEQYKKAYCECLKFYDIESYACEVKVFNKDYAYAGTIDRFALIRGEPYILDIKTSKKIEPVAELQVIAYGMCVPKYMRDLKYAVLQLRREGQEVKFTLRDFEYSEYAENVIISAKTVYDFAVSSGLV